MRFAYVVLILMLNKISSEQGPPKIRLSLDFSVHNVQQSKAVLHPPYELYLSLEYASKEEET